VCARMYVYARARMCVPVLLVIVQKYQMCVCACVSQIKATCHPALEKSSCSGKLETSLGTHIATLNMEYELGKPD
jgi:hypothetical protein